MFQYFTKIDSERPITQPFNISLKIYNNIFLKETHLNLRPDRPDLLLLLSQLSLQLEQLLQLVAEQSCKEKYEDVESEKRAQKWS